MFSIILPVIRAIRYFRFFLIIIEYLGSTSDRGNKNMKTANGSNQKAYLMASWVTLFIGGRGFLLGLFNADTLALSEKGFYLIGLMFGLHSAISLQKNLRDKENGQDVSNMFMGISWFALIASILVMGAGLFNADLALSEKGFYIMAFILSIYSLISVQKCIGDMKNEAIVKATKPSNKKSNRPTSIVGEAAEVISSL